ncbi:MAG: phenylalanine--tRNA ligase subunit beta [Deltaproteobacteria bacterium]|nr:phenylalanine--tRNA ligase subunit beta [Deltaproteobacteria bacterium]MBW1737175.1 phenylalanine--tRNA ligase subunit beta [Deltaproteobacteria bacterium]MBW1908747.1 phenylalanine--tRNA ligase subunit beta [Deltaproteobacteria bacterium]MBW2034387.1 phenylalanine--tRNA ligase subunit beta [Deltaproteobacteria bacterium]MBW2114302.1 phenylalanine--tRNA ligase subunit beta [Deltaproteobacteria bacterium]
MKLSLNWLQDYVDIEMSPDELGQLLTMTGLEVEGIEAAGNSLEEIVAAKILATKPHMEADRLSLCQVDTGREKVQVVCSAPNLEEGAMVPLALPGVKLPDGTIVKESLIRGETSTGMLLAEDEMGLTDDHSGIMILSSDYSPGIPLPSVLPVSDWVFDVDITPNRPDCASVIGIAREIAAVTGKILRRPEPGVEETGPDIKDLTSITIDDSSGCPRYAAGIIQDVALGPSPFWMRYRLYLSGIRSINNIVDVTNYVMLEMGQPLHAFDYNRLKENRIVVRRAREGEVFSTLDGEAHALNSEILMICDGERAVAVAGIMGGLNSEIFAGTRHVLLESAFFDPVTIRRGSKRLGLSTEASYRFERGADIEGVTTALKRAISLISDLAGGKISRGFIDNYPKPYFSPDIKLRVDRTNRILGTTISLDDMAGYLKALGMEVHNINEHELKVKPPSFRVDITREADLIEEVARLSGYDNIPVTAPSIRPSEEGEAPELLLRDKARSIMTGLGFTEIITYSFISPNSADMLGAKEESPLRSFVRLMNPLTVDQSVMRTSLVPGLLATVKNNILNQEKELKLFEWGKIFMRKEGEQLPVEKAFLAAVMTGTYRQKTWYADERAVDFYDIKGAVEAFLKGLGLQEFIFQRDNALPGYDPEISSRIYCSGSSIGQIGLVSFGTMEAYDLQIENAYLFELDIEALLKNLPGIKKFEPFTKFPAVYRDISIIIKRQLESHEIMEVIKQEGGELIESVRVFDLYEGEKMDPSKKALAFRICYRSKQGTLDGSKMNQLHESIIKKIRQKTGARLREG